MSADKDHYTIYSPSTGIKKDVTFDSKTEMSNSLSAQDMGFQDGIPKGSVLYFIPPRCMRIIPEIISRMGTSKLSVYDEILSLLEMEGDGYVHYM